MINISDQTHLVQTKQWAEFKSTYGNEVEKLDDIYLLVKKIPFLNSKMGYAPKVNFNVQNIDFEKLKDRLIKSNISFLRFDVPNILANTKQGQKWEEKLKKHCTLSPRTTFTKQNIYLDITPSEEELLKNMHSKRRYNIRYAGRKGIKVKVESSKEGLENFWKLHKETADRQKFLTHPKKYFEALHKTLKGKIYYVQAFYKKNIASSWLIIHNNKTIYYVYGGSNPKYNRRYPNDLVGFEAIKLGKELGAELFDMWGAEKGKGFTRFKMKYGGELLEYIPSYDFVVKNTQYKTFNFLYNSFWKLQDLKRKVF